MLRQELQPGWACGDPASAAPWCCQQCRVLGQYHVRTTVKRASLKNLWLHLLCRRVLIRDRNLCRSESRFVSTSFKCYLDISAPSLLLESLSEKHSQECLVFLRRLSPRRAVRTLVSQGNDKPTQTRQGDPSKSFKVETNGSWFMDAAEII